MSSFLMTLYVVIVQLLIWFFWADYFMLCVDGHPTSCCSILDSSAPLISQLWKYDLLISTVFRKV